MFWRVASGSVKSSVNAILDREDYSLRDLLADEEIIQEVQLPNERLLDVLCEKSMLAELARCVVLPPADTAEPGSAYKIPYVACEVLCCETEQLLDSIAANEDVIATLLTLPEPTAREDSVTCSFVARIITHLMRQRGLSVLAWLKDNQVVLADLTDRIGALGVPETLIALAGADDQLTASAASSDYMWLTETSILTGLLDRLEGGENSSLSGENTAEVLTAIARAKHSPLTQQLGSTPNLQRLLAQATNAQTTEARIQALNVCIALVERRRLWLTAHEKGLATPPEPADEELEQRAVDALAPHADRLLAHLTQIQQGRTQETPFGVLRPPLGSARLTVIALIAVLLRTGLLAAEEAVSEARLLERCMSLFTSYPFNSILHHQVTAIVGNVLDSGSETLVRHMLEDCGLVDWLLGLPAEITGFADAVTDASGRARPGLRAGYTGHVTQIGNRLLMAAESRAVVSKHLEAHKPWQRFALGRLAVANETEDVDAWDCGRPIPGRPFGGSDTEDGTCGVDPGVNGDFTHLSRFQAAFDSDSDSDDEGSARVDQLFADAPDQAPEDRDDLAASPTYRDLGSELAEPSGDGTQAATDPSKLFNRRARLFEEAMPSALADRGPESGALAPLLPEHDAAIPSNWEDLALEEAEPRRLLTPRPGAAPMVPNGSAAREAVGAGWAQPGGGGGGGEMRFSQPSGSLRAALQASMRPMDERVTDSCGASSGAEEPPSADLAELRQPAGSDDVDGPSLERRLSSDLADHPDSHQDDLDAEELRADTDNLLSDSSDEMGDEAPSEASARGPPGAESEVQTPVGSFTKLHTVGDGGGREPH